MSEDNDFWDTDPRQRGQGSLAFIAFMGWLICLPFDLCASLRRSTKRDPLGEDSGADWGCEHLYHGDVSK